MAAPSLNTVADAIEAVLVAALPVGTKVHDYFRLGKSDQELRTLMQTGTPPTARLHAWFITLTDGPVITTKPPYSPGCEQLDYSFSLHGWLSVDDADATEKLWRDEVELVMAALRASPKLGLSNVVSAYPPDWTIGGHRRIPPSDGGVLCHYAHLSLTVRVVT